MIKKILLLLTIATYSIANTFAINDNINSFNLNDQFEKQHTVNNTTKTIIFTSGKETSKTISEFLKAKDANYLSSRNTVYIADISGMPSLIARFFALPKMKDYKFPVLLISEEDDKRFIDKEDKITIYTLDNGVIKNIKYISTKEELEKI